MPITRAVRSALRVIAFVAIAIGVFAGPTSAWAQAPRDRAALTKAMADKFRAAMPDAQVDIKQQPLTLSIKPSGAANEFQVSLDRVWQFCSKNKSQCRAQMDDYVAKSATAMADAGNAPAAAPLDVSTLRLVVRPAGYVNDLRRQLAPGGPKSEPVVGLIAGDLWWVLVSDSSQSVRVIVKGELDDNKLGAGAAMEKARANLEAQMPPLSKVAARPGATGVSVIEGDYYASSRLLLNEDEWEKFARSFSGQLIAVAPDPRILLFADNGVKGARDTMDRMAEDYATRSDRPLSMALVQWTPDGWGPVAR
ncbi:MAG TPA: hypothetical protein VL966_00755 [Alphaproteobacteria bacterium]|nr:hypothetical protein [Alphaproteobacteria bacterium]